MLAWRDAASIGILMNTRGLMELIVLDIGMDLRVISPTLFAMLVMMALVTTFATTPSCLPAAIGRATSRRPGATVRSPRRHRVDSRAADRMLFDRLRWRDRD